MNKMRRARTSMSEVGSAPSKNDGGGVQGKGGGPGFESYAQDSGPDTIPYKSKETSFGTAKDQVNQMQRATNSSPNGRAKEATSSTINKSKNNYRRARGNTVEMGKKM